MKSSFKVYNSISFDGSGEVKAVAVQPAEQLVAKMKPLTKQRRVVVTGMGVVTPLGHDPEVFYRNLLEGASGISEIETFDCSQFPTVILANHLLRSSVPDFTF